MWSMRSTVRMHRAAVVRRTADRSSARRVVAPAGSGFQSSVRRMRGQHIVGCPARPGAVPSTHESAVEAAVRVRRRWSGDPRVVVDVIVAVVVAVLSVLDVAAANDASRGSRPADALAYALVI